ncbi:hypothetical protein ARMSODRAFT_633075 [Armillaria solidipes]|uniref:Uncharacterized protein n=1 Tax=Armillaria solidipes TaxID=1076256 RepID=A0A2H3BUX7_9AGAR|nr:hypothetical protein ARMSODRAFT_633075 [Armillaria solidipes]
MTNSAFARDQMVATMLPVQCTPSRHPIRLPILRGASARAFSIQQLDGWTTRRNIKLCLGHARGRSVFRRHPPPTSAMEDSLIFSNLRPGTNMVPPLKCYKIICDPPSTKTTRSPLTHLHQQGFTPTGPYDHQSISPKQTKRNSTTLLFFMQTLTLHI